MNEKGLSLIELLITVFLVSITTILCIICLKGVTNKNNNNCLIEDYLNEKLKLMVGLNSMYKVTNNNLYNITYENNVDAFNIYRSNKLIVEYKDNCLNVPENNMYIKFKIIKNIEIYNNSNYLIVRISSDLIIEEIKETYLKGLSFHYIKEMKEVIPLIFE